MSLQEGCAARLVTLGPPCLVVGGVEVLPGRRKELALLAYLARRSPSAVSRAELATLLWGDRGEDRARQSLRQSLSTLRHAVNGALEIDGESVRVVPDTLFVDAAAFEAEIAAGQLDAALARWDGPFLAGADGAGSGEFRVWLDAQRAQLGWRLQGALDGWTAGAEAEGDWARMLERAERWVELLPDGFAGHRQRVRALYLAGRTDEALGRHAAFAAQREAGGDFTAAERTEWRELGRQLERARQTRTGPRRRPGPAALFAADMVGRADAFGELRAGWEEARAGRAGVVVVSGEEGSGKTRLVDEFAQWLAASHDEAVVLHAHGWASERGVAWRTARELLSRLRDAPGLGGAATTSLAALARIVPVLLDRFPALPPPPRDDHALPAALLDVLEAVAVEVPLVLLVDDLAHADAESARLLLALARRMPAAGVLLIVTAGTDTHGGGAPVPEQALPAARRIRLAPLSAEEIGSLVTSALPLPAAECRLLAEQLRVESGGNPLYTVELLCALADEGYVRPGDDGTWAVSGELADGPLPLPGRVRELVSRRLTGLDVPARRVLEAAAVIGDRFALRRLETSGEFAPEALAAALDRLIERRLVRPVSGPPGAYAFNHAVVRRVAYDRLPPARQEALLRSTTSGREPWYRRLWQAPDEASVDAGAEGEWLAARLRLPVMALLLVLPTLNLLQLPDYGPYRTGFAVTLLAALVAVALYLVLWNGGYRPWLGFVSSSLDVSLVSLGLASFLWAGDPHAAVNSKPTFEIFFLAVFGSSLRYDRRICITAGLAACVQYLAIVVYASTRWPLNDPAYAPFPYGMFSWTAQGGRLILLLASTLLAWEIVRRAQRLRRNVTHDPVTGLPNRQARDVGSGKREERMTNDE
jgi:DNA-binding SARP family transcriptional activator